MSAPANPPSSEAETLVRIGTRRSALALRQTDLVMAALRAAHANLTFEVSAMATAGDRDTTTPLPALGKGLWTSELEARLASKDVDVVVHSLKDMPTTLPDGCELACVTQREDPRDVLVMSKKHAAKGWTGLADLPRGSVVGTSSVRRAAQLRRRYPDLVFKDVRGNIETRLNKCDAEGEAEAGYDAIILAAAGLLRLGYGERIAQYLDSKTPGGGLLHAVGQGALGLEIRAGDERMRALLKAVEDTPTMLACFAERSVMRTLEGGCSVPIGVETEWLEEGKLRLRVVVVSLDGSRAVEDEATSDVSTLAEAEAMGRELALKMAKNGAQEILDEINQGRTSGAALKVGDA
ncbi:hypothetical protein VTJ83DRAFT_1867 [Remersonia thermophila]|uniref:hydroxymethylbilane synthase n=1 Tax=Remersonia thermophila TaxID=72144 RepID=A0ABR4DH44_9PEZI